MELLLLLVGVCVGFYFLLKKIKKKKNNPAEEKQEAVSNSEIGKTILTIEGQDFTLNEIDKNSSDLDILTETTIPKKRSKKSTIKSEDQVKKNITKKRETKKPKEDSPKTRRGKK